MQIFARDAEGKLVTAAVAEPGIDYHCPECDAIIRLRAGTQRVRHFYHHRRTRNCRQGGKTLAHLRTQEKLFRLLGDSQLEHPFPQISRIADLYWPAENLVFEVQCSPITAEEVAARNDDYASLGLTVVWILHEKRYNRRHLTAAEHFLWDKPHYFTNIDADGRGYFYDQKKLVKQGRVIRRLPPLRVNLDQPLPTGGFAGDASCFPDYLAQLDVQEPKQRHRWLSAVYRLVLTLLLEKSC